MIYNILLTLKTRNKITKTTLENWKIHSAFVTVLIFSIERCLVLRASLPCACVGKSAFVYLLLVLPLQVNPGLDVTSRLLEGLSLGDLGRVVGADPDYISAKEDQHVGADLSARRSKARTQQ